MARLLVILVLACILCAGLSLCGCTAKHNNAGASQPWPPDTIWFVKSSGATYYAYYHWPPETTSTMYELSTMRGAPPSLINDTMSNKRTPGTLALHIQTAGANVVAPFEPWPPDTLRVARVKFVPRAPSY